MFSDKKYQSVFFRLIILTVFVLFMFLFPETSFAQLISPGPLLKAHSHLEGIKNCTKCHDSNNSVSDNLCLSCHITIKNEWNGGTGFHAWIKKNENKNCVKCHSDHNGETFNPIRWLEGTKEKFDHKKTGYPLTGSHAKQKCENCHKPENHDPLLVAKDESLKSQDTFLALSVKCQSCHIDEHRGTLGNDCESCHTTDKWKVIPKFNHAKTNFALTGKHEKTDCLKCHKPVDDPLTFHGKTDPDYLKMKGLDFKNCTPCHDNPHPPSMGSDCNSCHVTEGWTIVKTGNKFNHDITGYPLTGEHKNLDCKTCHFEKTIQSKADVSKLVVSNFLKKKMDYSSCQSCHMDAHNKQFMKDGLVEMCETCHTTDRFKPSTFTETNHATTKFKLTGGHASVACIDCHRKATDKNWIFHPLKTECITCHKDIHNHQTEKWMKKSETGEFQCETCHRVEDWKTITFDHNLTTFSLTGEHSKVSCIDCHKETFSSKSEKQILFLPELSTSCESCHKDVHEGQFTLADGKIKCERCHTPDSWILTTFKHDVDSRFKLEGAHSKVECASCHKLEPGKFNKEVIHFKPLEVTCESCHG